MKYYHVHPSPKLFSLLLKQKLYEETGVAEEFFSINGDCADYFFRDCFQLDKILLLTIAVKHRRIVGWCIAFKSAHRALRDSLWCYVTPLQRRKGVGTILVRKTTGRLGRTNFRTDDNGHKEIFWGKALKRNRHDVLT